MPQLSGLSGARLSWLLLSKSIQAETLKQLAGAYGTTVPNFYRTLRRVQSGKLVSRRVWHRLARVVNREPNDLLDPDFSRVDKGC